MSQRGRRHFNRGHDRNHSYVESPEDQLKKSIFSFGEHPDSDIDTELKRTANFIRNQGVSMLEVTARLIQTAVIGQPHKVYFLAKLVCSLYMSTELSTDTSQPEPLGQQLLQHCWKFCKETTEDTDLHNLRPWIQFFSYMAVLKVVSTDSLLQLIQNISRAFDELGASTIRLSIVTACILDSLVRAGKTLWEYDSEATESLIKSVSVHLSEAHTLELVTPFLYLHNTSEMGAPVSECRSQLSSVLNSLLDSQFDLCDDISPDLQTSTLKDVMEPPIQFTLEDILLPPEQIDVSTNDSTSSKHGSQNPHFTIFIFDTEVTPPPISANGYFVRTLIADIVESYEINRKECAQVLVNLPRWLNVGTFQYSRQSSVQDEQLPREGKWQLASTLVETLLSRVFGLPSPSLFPAYFSALICELCRISPGTFGPAVGKCFRKLHDMTGEGLDVEISRRFIEWFAIHMSNFEFRWPPWQEWSSDLALSPDHPRKLFIRRVLDKEVRLAYYDRILRSVPEPFQTQEAGVLPEQAPSSDFDYSDPNHSHNALAREILIWLQGRTDPDEVIKGIESHREKLVDAGENDLKAFSTIRQIVVQSLLEIGARSFSHFLNAVERYIKLIRHVSASKDSKTDILESITRFWSKNPQMMLIAFDKFMQYQFTEPSDHISWAFEMQSGYIGGLEWEIIKSALDKAKGRVFIVQKKVDQLRKEQDDAAALQKAQEDADIETDVNLDSEKLPQSAALTSALNSKEALLAEQQRSLWLALENFIRVLSPTESLFSEDSWRRHDDWSEAEHKSYETWGWFRNFCRTYNPQLVYHSQALSSKFDEKMTGRDKVSDQLLRRYWTLTLGEDR